MPLTNGNRTHQAKERSWATHISAFIVAFALLAPTATVLWGNAGALAGFTATALTIVAVMKLSSFMHFHDSLRCGPAACPWLSYLCYECLMLRCFLGSRALLLGAACSSSSYLTMCLLLGLATLLEITASHGGILALGCNYARANLSYSISL